MEALNSDVHIRVLLGIGEVIELVYVRVMITALKVHSL
jgi:hypothetical protein